MPLLPLLQVYEMPATVRLANAGGAGPDGAVQAAETALYSRGEGAGGVDAHPTGAAGAAAAVAAAAGGGRGGGGRGRRRCADTQPEARAWIALITLAELVAGRPLSPS